MTLNYLNSGAPAYLPNMYPPTQNRPGQVPQQNIPNMPNYQNPYQGYYAMPNYPVYGQQMPYTPQVNNGSPSVSAVKIDINGASVGSGASSQIPSRNPGMTQPMYPGRAQMMAPTPQFMPPNMNYPQNPYPSYIGQNQPEQPYIMPNQAVGLPQQQQQAQFPAPPPPVVGQQVNNTPVSPPPAAVAQQAPPQPAVPQQPNTPQQPVVNQQPIQQSAVPQQPVAQNEQPVNPAEKAQPQPAVDQQPQQNQIDPSVQPLFQALKIITPEPGQQISFEQQGQAIQTIAQYAKTAQAANDMIKAKPEDPTAQQAKQKVKNLITPLLMDENVFKGLVSVATNDTSAINGTEKQKAEENKLISMWTLAMLQKVFREEMNGELQKDNIPPISINEIPGVSQIVGNIKADPNPEIREAGIVALMEVADQNNQRDVDTMKVILETAIKSDENPGIRETAIAALMEFIDPKDPNDAKTVKPLLQAVAENDSSKSVKTSAKNALKQLK